MASFSGHAAIPQTPREHGIGVALLAMLAKPDGAVSSSAITLLTSAAGMTNLSIRGLDDKALAVSRRVWGNEARVGQVDPRMEPYRTIFAKARISVIDLTDKKTSDPVNHAKFAESPQVVRLIGRRLAQGQVLTDAQSGLGERVSLLATGAAKTVGSAAGLAVSVPLAVVDGRTRESLGAQARHLGGSVGDTIGSVGGVVTGR